MKKVILMMVAVAITALTVVQAQEIPERKRGEFRPVHKERMHGKKELASLNLSEEQKTKMKAMNQDFRKKMEDLRKQDNITVKESREKMEALRKDHQAKFQSVLTAEQKTQMEKDKEARKAKAKEFGEKRQARMKEQLKLTEEQSKKMAEQRKVTSEKMKTIRENAALSDLQKREQVKEVMKKQKEEMKSILTEEQLQKMKENRKQGGKKKRPEMI